MLARINRLPVSEFRAAFRSRKIHTPAFVVHVRKVDGVSLGGMIVSGKNAGNAVNRNRVRRHISEMLSGFFRDTPEGVQIFVVAKAGANNFANSELQTQLEKALAKVG